MLCTYSKVCNVDSVQASLNGYSPTMFAKLFGRIWTTWNVFDRDGTEALI